jgi:hypothetical protein
MTVRDAFKDEMAMLDELAGCSEPTEHWLEEVLTNVDAETEPNDYHNLIHSVLWRIIRETLMRIYGTMLWVSTDLTVKKDPKPHYSLGVMVIEKDTGICITWDKRTKTPYLYRDLYSVDDFVGLLEDVALRVDKVLGYKVRGNYSSAVTSAWKTLNELLRSYGVRVAGDVDLLDVVEYLCTYPNLCAILLKEAELTKETDPHAIIALRLHQTAGTKDVHLEMQVVSQNPNQPSKVAG